MDGYGACLEETIAYLISVERCAQDDPLIVTLRHHLVKSLAYQEYSDWQTQQSTATRSDCDFSCGEEEAPIQMLRQCFVGCDLRYSPAPLDGVGRAQVGPSL